MTQQPLRSAPEYQPSTTRKIVGGSLAAALGGLEGLVNASGRTRVPTGGAAALGDSIVYSKYNQAKQAYDEKQAVLMAQAQIEAKRAEDERKLAVSKATISAKEAQAQAAKAAQAKAERPEVTKPVVVGGALVDPTTKEVLYKAPEKPRPTAQTIDQYINEISADPTLTDEVKNDRINKRLVDHNRAHPDKPITKIEVNDQGQLTAVAVQPSAVLAAGGKLDLGAGGKTAKKAVAKAAAGGGVAPLMPAGPLSATAQGVYDGRVLFHKLDVKDKKAVRQELLAKKPDWREPDVTTAGERKVEAAGESAVEGLLNLGKLLEDNKGSIGPGKSLMKYVPGSTASKIQAQIDLIKQRVGKQLESGVLRKEDEKKYEKILATIDNTPSVAQSKIAGVVTELQRDLQVAAAQRSSEGRNRPTATGGKKPPVTTSGELAVGQRRFNKRKGYVERITSINGDDIIGVPDPD